MLPDPPVSVLIEYTTEPLQVLWARHTTGTFFIAECNRLRVVAHGTSRDEVARNMAHAVSDLFESLVEDDVVGEYLTELGISYDVTMRYTSPLARAALHALEPMATDVAPPTYPVAPAQRRHIPRIHADLRFQERAAA